MKISLCYDNLDKNETEINSKWLSIYNEIFNINNWKQVN